MYEPYTWVTGEVITAEKLNKLEQGVEENALNLNNLEQEVATVLPPNETGTDAVLMSVIDDDEPVVGWTPLAFLPFPLNIGEGLADGDTLDDDMLGILNGVIATGGIAFLIAELDGVGVYFYLSAKDETAGKVTFESGSQYNANYYFEIALDTGEVSRKGGII